MIISALYLCVTIALFNYYIKERYRTFAIVYAFMISSGFSLLPASNVKIYDFLLLLFVLVSLYENGRSNRFFTVKNDKVAMFTLILISYYFVIFVGTIVFTSESLENAFKVFRTDLWMLQYFIIRRIPYSEIQKSYRFIFMMTTMTGVLYFLQFWGITGILRFSSENVSSVDGLSRYNNAPIFAIPILLYILFLNPQLKNKAFWISFFAALLILPMVRGAIIAFIGTSIIYVVITRKLKSYFAVFLYALCAFLLFYPVIESRFSNSSGISTHEDIKNALQIKRGQYDIRQGGSFYYRIALLLERVEYIQSENKMLTGVGTIHEDSPSNNFRLYVGKSIYENRSSLIDTNDIAFATRIFRYGFIYLVLYCLYIIAAFRSLIRHKNEAAGTMGFLTLSIITFQCLGSDGFSMFDRMLIPIIFIACCNNQYYGRNSHTQLQQ